MSTVPEPRGEPRAIPPWLSVFTRCPATDPIGMEFTIDEGDPAVRRQLIATQLETAAAVYERMAEGAANLAKVYSEGG